MQLALYKSRPSHRRQAGEGRCARRRRGGCVSRENGKDTCGKRACQQHLLQAAVSHVTRPGQEQGRQAPAAPPCIQPSVLRNVCSQALVSAAHKVMLGALRWAADPPPPGPLTPIPAAPQNGPPCPETAKSAPRNLAESFKRQPRRMGWLGGVGYPQHGRALGHGALSGHLVKGISAPLQSRGAGCGRGRQPPCTKAVGRSCTHAVLSAPRAAQAAPKTRTAIPTARKPARASCSTEGWQNGRGAQGAQPARPH